MLRKYFPLDKNYILKEAQISLEKELLLLLVNTCKQTYLQRFNPLGIVDSSVAKILAHQEKEFPLLVEFYHHLAAIYRYTHGNNQLELLFDGTDHFTKYSQDWRTGFTSVIHTLLQNDHFLKAILESTVFFPTDRKAHLAANRLKAYMSQTLELKVTRHKGIMRVA
jgi:hypothetical protein